ncbi:MAG: cytochrome c3 family protein [Eggerthellaceae bacterium]|nr:cytochrome c3 family protein [Eggerthellaceae bacterium]
MSKEETISEAVAEEVEAVVDGSEDSYATDDAQEVSPKKKKKKLPLVLGVLFAVFILAGAGFWFWHEQPSFCSAICHTPMDPYGKTFEYSSGQPGIDKWGNEVSNAGAMLSVAHKEKDVDCLACHVPSIGEQITEGLHWVAGSYEKPLYERDLENLVEARGIEPEQFCLNDSCHHVSSAGADIKSREDLSKAMADELRNPHRIVTEQEKKEQPQHEEQACSTCHKAHRASVNYCTQCHIDAPVPDGWLTVVQSLKLDKPVAN